MSQVVINMDEQVTFSTDQPLSHLLLFNRWSFDGLQINDPGLINYISINPVVLPYSGGRHQKRQFRKADVSIVERFVNKLMSPGRNTGKKFKCLRAVEGAFEIIHISTSANPLQILVDAVTNAAPNEETTRVTHGGIAQHQAVDVSPSRRVDLALRFLTNGIREKAFSNVLSFEELIADELIKAANNDTASNGVRKKEELERIALSAR